MSKDAISRRGLFQLLKDPPPPSSAKTLPAFVSKEVVQLYHAPDGAACARWSDHMRRAGFVVKTSNGVDLKSARERLGVPPDLGACHTAEVAGYAIEGHVPAIAVRRLLEEKPEAAGLAVAGMPAGAPGVECLDEDTYDVVLFGPSFRRVYMRFVGPYEIGTGA